MKRARKRALQRGGVARKRQRARLMSKANVAYRSRDNLPHAIAIEVNNLQNRKHSGIVLALNSLIFSSVLIDKWRCQATISTEHLASFARGGMYSEGVNDTVIAGVS